MSVPAVLARMVARVLMTSIVSSATVQLGTVALCAVQVGPKYKTTYCPVIGIVLGDSFKNMSI